MRKLGRTDIEITPIGLGCWQFSAARGIVGGYWPALGDEVTRAIVAATLEGGINWFDTAEAYGGGESERALARALHALGKKDGEVVIATKWLPVLRTARSIVDTIEDRLACLGGFSIDLHQIHQPFGSVATHGAQMEALAELVRMKKIKAAGVSNFSVRAMRECHEVLAKRGVPLASNQVRYSLLDRKIEGKGLIRAAKDLGVTIIAYSPLAQGLLTGKFHDDPRLITKSPGPRRWLAAFRARGLERSRPVVDAVREIARELDATPAQVALRWVIQFHGDTVVAIPGASKLSQAADNIGAQRISLTSAQLARLDEASRPFLA